MGKGLGIPGCSFCNTQQSLVVISQSTGSQLGDFAPQGSFDSQHILIVPHGETTDI